MIDGYGDWCSRYAATFGMNSAEDVAMFDGWESTFTSKGYSVDELFIALAAISSRPEPLKWRDHHLAAIHFEIRQHRERENKEEKRQEAENSERSFCELCFDTGQVIVPHPRFVKDSTWQHHGATQPTCAVVCCCRRGERIHEAQTSRGLDRPQLLLLQYEQRVPRNIWRGFLIERDGERRQDELATNRTRAADSRLGALAAGVAKEFAAF